jgi:hypothetical protein
MCRGSNDFFFGKETEKPMVSVLRKAIIAGPVALLALLISTTLVFAQTASFAFVSSPNPGTTKSLLVSTSALSNADVWAVGDSNSTASEITESSGDRTLIEHWNGTAWSVVSSPNAFTGSADANDLLGVSADSDTDAWAVGSATPNQAPAALPLAEHWNGTAWNLVSVPSTHTGETLAGVSADSATDAWAVGAFTDFTPFSSAGPVIHHWDGKTWSSLAVPAGVFSLDSVVALSSTNAWATGNTPNNTLLHWDGKTWSLFTGPNFGQGIAATFLSLSASAADDIWATGQATNGDGTGPFIAHFDGTSWQLRDNSTDSQFFNNTYVAIAAHSSTDALVVGSNAFSGKPAVEQWDGASWHPVSFVVPQGAGINNAQEGVTFTPGGDAWIVGGALFSTQTTTTEQTFAAHCGSC